MRKKVATRAVLDMVGELSGKKEGGWFFKARTKLQGIIMARIFSHTRGVKRLHVHFCGGDSEKVMVEKVR